MQPDSGPFISERIFSQRKKAEGLIFSIAACTKQGWRRYHCLAKNQPPQWLYKKDDAALKLRCQRPTHCNQLVSTRRPSTWYLYQCRSGSERRCRPHRPSQFPRQHPHQRNNSQGCDFCCQRAILHSDHNELLYLARRPGRVSCRDGCLWSSSGRGPNEDALASSRCQQGHREATAVVSPAAFKSDG